VPDARRPTPDLRYVALGAASELADRMRAVAGGGRILLGPAAWLGRRAPAPLRRTVGDAVRRLDEQGRATAAAGTGQVTHLAEALAGDLAHEPLVVETIEEIIAQVQWHVVDDLLPAVLERLAADPEQVRAIVQGQSRGMAEELARTARNRAVEGDEAVDRVLARVLHRATQRHRIDRPGPSLPLAPDVGP
jgi:hypothetical protein